MGTVNWTLGGYGNDDNKNLRGTRDRASDEFTSSTSEGAITGLTAAVGDVLSISVDEPAWVRFGGRTAALGTGFYLNANETTNFEISFGDEGAVSIIDVA